MGWGTREDQGGGKGRERGGCIGCVFFFFSTVFVTQTFSGTMLFIMCFLTSDIITVLC